MDSNLPSLKVNPALWRSNRGFHLWFLWVLLPVYRLKMWATDYTVYPSCEHCQSATRAFPGWFPMSFYLSVLKPHIHSHTGKNKGGVHRRKRGERKPIQKERWKPDTEVRGKTQSGRTDEEHHGKTQQGGKAGARRPNDRKQNQTHDDTK